MTKKRAPEPPAADTPATFEAAIARLGVIVEDLESGNLSLEDSLKHFEEGIRLARSSQEQLDRAETRIEELLEVQGDGVPVVEEIEP